MEFNRAYPAILLALFMVFSGHAATLSFQVSSGNDDAEERLDNGDMYRTSSDLELVNDGSRAQAVGIRFTNVSVVQGAAITNAVIDFVVDETDSEATSISFHGQAADDPPGFSSSDFDITSRTQTTASVNWNNVPPWNSVGTTQTTPDLSSIIQEIVNRPGWVSGNSIVIIIEGSGQRTAESYNGSSSSAPTLQITTEVADLEVQKSVTDSTPDENDLVTFTLSVTNNGPDDSTGIVVSDILPSGLTYVSDTSGGSYNSTTGNWSIGAIANGNTASIDITVSVDSGTTGSTITNVATITSSSVADNNSVNNSANQQVRPGAVEADLSISGIDSPDPVLPGGTVTYTLTVVNNGPDSAATTNVINSLPPTFTFTSAVTTKGSCGESGGTVTCGLGTLTSSETVTITIQGTAPGSTGVLGNIASVSSAADDTDLSNNTVTIGTVVNATNQQICYAVSDNNNSLSSIAIDVGAPPWRRNCCWR